MCNMLVCGGVYYRIAAGIVHFEGDSAGEVVHLSMPIGDFRAAVAQAQAVLAEFDAGNRVLMFGGGH